MQNIMGNNMLIAVEAKADYVSAILKVANSALLSKRQYLSAVSGDTRKTGDKQRRWQVGRSAPGSAKHFPGGAATPGKLTPDKTHAARAEGACISSTVTSPSAARRLPGLGAARAGQK